MLTRILLGSIFTLAVFGPGVQQVRAQDNNYYKQQVINYLEGNAALKELRKYDFAPLDDGIRTGYINNGEFQDALYHLEKGYAYAFVGQCDEDCRQLTFELFDPEGNRIGTDETSGDTPVIWLLVTQSGDYRIRATMPSCGGLIGCYWGVEAVVK